MDDHAMDHRQVGRYWEQNAEAWTALTRAGYDICRIGFNTPRFMEMLPDVTGLRGLDIGCGEGSNTRIVAERGARMVGIDIAPTFIGHAAQTEQESPMGIVYQVASAVELPFADGLFDFVVAFMSLMDTSQPHRPLREAHRVLRPGGFLQFSILHPCFVPPHRRNLRDDEGRFLGLELNRYFDNVDGEVEQWMFHAAPEELKAKYEKFNVPRFHRTPSWWLNTLIATGFVIEQIAEPRPDDEAVARWPTLRDEQIMPLYLHVRARRP